MSRMKNYSDDLATRYDLLTALILGVLLMPVTARAQSGARDAMAAFPADTQQIVYSNLAQLRALPDYQQIRNQLFTPQLQDFEGFMRSMGTDPEKDVNEVTLGWRGEITGGTDYFGMAEGNFDTGRVHDYFVNSKLPIQSYGGYDLYAFGSGQDRNDLYFAFVSASQALFGRLSNVKAALDVQAGKTPALDSKQDFVDWEGELEGTSPQWGIATGAIAAARVAPWFSGGEKLPFDPQAVMKPVRAVLYRVDWNSGFTAHLSIVCDSDSTAAALAQVAQMWRDARQSNAGSLPPQFGDFLRTMQISANGSRVEMTGSGPVAVVSMVFRGPAPAPAPTTP